MPQNIFYKRIALCALFAFIPLLAACDLKIPVKEMVLAKAAISHALDYKSDRYAPKETEEARQRLMKAHTLVLDGKPDDAKTEAELAEKKAHEAYSITLPLISMDTINNAKTLYAEAGVYGAEFFSQNEYSQGNGYIQAAEDFNSQKKYIEAYETALQAVPLLTAAKENSAAKGPVLKEKVAALKKDAEALSSAPSVAQKVAAASALLAEAAPLVDSLSLRSAYPKITEAEKILTTAKEESTREAARKSAQDKLAAVESGVKKINESDLKDQFAADIAAITPVAAEARTQFDAGNFAPSLEKSEAALPLIDALTIKMEKRAEEIRIAAAAAQKPAAAEPALAAETGAVTDTVPPPATAAAETEEPAREYTVQYNPKNRDCLWLIAEREYKDARMWPLIYMANRDQIKDPDLIFPGQKLKIPPIPKKKKDEPVSTANKTQSDAASTNGTPPSGKKAESVIPAKPAEAVPVSPQQPASPNTDATVSEPKNTPAAP